MKFEISYAHVRLNPSFSLAAHDDFSQQFLEFPLCGRSSVGDWEDIARRCPKGAPTRPCRQRVTHHTFDQAGRDGWPELLFRRSRRLFSPPIS